MYPVNQSLLVIIITAAALALLYFYVFGQLKQRYIGLLGLSCAAFSVSFMFDINRFNSDLSTVLLACKMTSVLISNLFLYCAINGFLSQKVPKYMLIMVVTAIIWINIFSYSGASVTLIALPVCILSVIISLLTSLQLLLYDWERDGIEKHVAGWTILFLGLHRAYYPFIKPDINFSHLEYTTATLLVLILNICLLIIYFQKAHADLTERERHFRLLAENARDFIYQYTFSPVPGFQYASPASAAITGFFPEEFYHDPQLFMERIDDNDGTTSREMWESPEKMRESLTFRWKRRDGKTIWLEQNNTIIYDDEGTAIAVEGIMRDITERKEVEERILKMEESRRQLLANISHDLRTPITTIQGYVQAILDGVISGAGDQENYLRLILHKTAGLNRLIQDLFDLSQLETGAISLQLQLISVEDLFMGVKEKFEVDVKDAGIDFQVSMEIPGISAQNPFYVIIDPDRIDQVFANLIFNAVKHTDRGGCIRVTFKLSEINNVSGRDLLGEPCILVEVQDTGCGIPAEDVPYIFDRFYKCDKYRGSAEKGSGLGLAICKEIITLHRGNIWVDTTLKEGSTFSFNLPLYVPEPIQMPAS